MTDFVIRGFEPDDEVDVRRLTPRLAEGFASWRDPAKVHEAVNGWINTALDNSQTDGHALMVATHNGGVIGFISIALQHHYIAGRDAYIGELAVDETIESRGVGRALLAAATDWARAQGCERLTLQTGAANARARGFYEKLGFSYEDVSMAREL